MSLINLQSKWLIPSHWKVVSVFRKYSKESLFKELEKQTQSE
jgi:hypothetical protein